MEADIAEDGFGEQQEVGSDELYGSKRGLKLTA